MGRLHYVTFNASNFGVGFSLNVREHCCGTVDVGVSGRVVPVEMGVEAFGSVGRSGFVPRLSRPKFWWKTEKYFGD